MVVHVQSGVAPALEKLSQLELGTLRRLATESMSITPFRTAMFYRALANADIK